MEKALTPEQRNEIEERIKKMTFPEAFKNDKSFYPLYLSNLFDILEHEMLGGKTNKNYIELLRNNNHRMLRTYIETRQKDCNGYQYNFNAYFCKWQVSHPEIGACIAEFRTENEVIEYCNRG